MGFFSSITAFDVLIEAIGILGIIASIISFQCKKHSRLLLFRSANESLFALQYGLLGAYTGMAMNVIGVVRNIVFTELVKRKKSTVPARIAFGAVFVVFVAVTWAGFKSLLSGTAKVISTFAYGSTNFALTRVLIFITSTSWFVYNLLVKSYAGCACELLTIGSIIVSLIRYKSDKKKLAVATADAAATDTTTDGPANNYTATADTADTATDETTLDDTATD
ncbi:MAG: YgjV family protein [Clostridiales bacterium]|nr:YgjV family protein [Clostridiales bacterium]